ncbi:hypothetical protein ACOSQ3_010576 [Xanthoceras sorbifolium]
MDDPDLIWTALLHGFIESIEIDKSMKISPWIHRIESMEESMELPCPKLRRSSRRRRKARRRSKIFGEQIEEPHRRTDRRTTKLVLQLTKNPEVIEEPDETGSSINEEPRNF